MQRAARSAGRRLPLARDEQLLTRCRNGRRLVCIWIEVSTEDLASRYAPRELVTRTRGQGRAPVTLEGPDGKRYLVRSDGSLVTEGPVRLDELTPESRRIVEALRAARAWADRTTKAQGLPVKLTEPVTVSRVATLMKPR